MKKGSKWLLLTAAFYAMTAAPAFAEAEAVATKATGGANTFYLWVSGILAVTMVLASICASFAQSNAVRAAVEGIARNPGASGKIFTTLVIGLAMIESLAIYVFVIALILLFVNPFGKFIG